MPRILNKIIINGETSNGERARVVSEYSNLQFLATEMQEQGFFVHGAPQSSKVDEFTETMEKLCEAHCKADDDFVQGMRALGNDMRKFIDSQP